MMRPVDVYVPSTLPQAPVLTHTPGGAIVITWTDGTAVAYTDPSTWTSHADEIGYRILRSTDGGATFTQAGTALANATSWTDPTAEPGIDYTYQVVAWNEAGDSASNTVVARVGLTVTASSATITFGDAAPVITASYAPAAPAPATAPSCSVEGYAPGSPAGTYTTSCSGITTPDPVYRNQVVYVTGTLTVVPAPLTITGPSANVTYGDAVPALDPIYTGLLGGATTTVTPATCSTTYTAGASVTGSPYPVTCSGAVDPNYAITYAAGAITVGQALVTVTAADATATFGQDAPAIGATYNPPITPATPATCSAAYTAGDPVAGSYTTSCSGAADPNHSFTYVPGVLTVVPALVTVTASDATTTFGTAAPAITPSYLPAFTPATAPVCQAAYAIGDPVGTYRTWCELAADPNLVFAYTDGTLTVVKDLVAVTAPTLVVSYGDAVPGLVPVYAGGVVPAVAATCVTDYTPTSTVAGGPYAVTCSGASDPNHDFTYLAGSITVIKAWVVVTADSPVILYGDAVPVIGATYSPAMTPDTAPTCSTVYTAGAPVTAAGYATSCSGALDANHDFTYVDGVVTVNPAPLTVGATSPVITYGDPVPAIAPIYTGLVAGDLAPATLPLCETSYSVGSPAGTYASWCAGAADPNYAISVAWGTVTVLQAPQSIAFGPLADHTWGEVTFTVSATATSGLPVAFASTTPAVCTADGSALITMTGTGTCTLVASQAGDGNWLAAPSVTASLTILQAPTTTTFVQDFDPTRTITPVHLAVTVVSVNPAAGTPTGQVQLLLDGAVSGAPVTLDAAGTAVITVPTMAVGVHTLVVRYLGDTLRLGGDSAAATHTVVSRLPTTTSVVSDIPASVYSQPVTFTATVTPVNASLGTVPTGTVRFRVNGNTIGFAAVDASGRARLTVSTIAVGSQVVTATYNADTSYAASTSPSITQVVTAASTTTALSTAAVVSRSGTIVYTATVTALAPATGTPTGTVRFYRGTRSIGSAALVGGVATFDYLNIQAPLGTFPIRAVYVGSTRYSTSTSPDVSQTITP